MPAAVTTDSAPDKAYRGHVGFISPTAEFTPKTVETRELRTDLVYRLRVVVDNPDGGLRQGMPVTVTLRRPGRTAERLSRMDRRTPWPWSRASPSGSAPAGRRRSTVSTLAIEPGQVTGLVGPDGAGKTTLLRLLAGLLLPDEGQLTVCGFDTGRDLPRDPPAGQLHAAAVRAVRGSDGAART